MSKIEWTERTWNPIVGCSVVSPGCTNCYAMRMAARLERMGTRGYAGLTQPSKAGPVWTGKVGLVETALTLPLRTRKPTTWFVNSMSDLFHESVPDEWIDRVFAVMALCPQHTFQVLTKRSARMRQWATERWQPAPAQRIPLGRGEFIDVPAQVEGETRWHRVNAAMDDIPVPDDRRFWTEAGDLRARQFDLPLPNVWLGVSAEDQRRADERVPDLLATPAAVRFVSAEPLIGPLDLAAINTFSDGYSLRLDGLRGISRHQWHSEFAGPGYDPGPYGMIDSTKAGLDWIIVGGESGPGARPMHPAWARLIRDQCTAAGVAFHFKQWGAWLDEQEATARHLAPGPEMFDRFGSPKGPKWHPYEAADRNGGMMISVGKKRAGRLLDGVTHDGFPTPHKIEPRPAANDGTRGEV